LGTSEKEIGKKYHPERRSSTFGIIQKAEKEQLMRNPGGKKERLFYGLTACVDLTNSRRKRGGMIESAEDS